MTREIKFRAWDGEEMYIPTIQDIDVENDINYFFGHIKAEVMQYTGIKDKHGKEIYEGDIVKLVYLESEGGGWVSHDPVEFGRVYFDPRWGVKFDCRDKTQRVAEYWERVGLNEVRNVEIIGNIYESPELLQDTK